MAVLRKNTGKRMLDGSRGLAPEAIFMVQPPGIGVAITSVCSGSDDRWTRADPRRATNVERPVPGWRVGRSRAEWGTHS
jgi:hypothetical protein